MRRTSSLRTQRSAPTLIVAVAVCLVAGVLAAGASGSTVIRYCFNGTTDPPSSAACFGLTMDPAVECSTRLFGQMGCVPDFPSITTPILDFTMGQGYDVAGIAADVVASVALLDTAGVPVAKAAVANNLYSLPTASRPNVASLVALDASGNTLYSTPMPGAPR